MPLGGEDPAAIEAYNNAIARASKHLQFLNRFYGSLSQPRELLAIIQTEVLAQVRAGCPPSVVNAAFTFRAIGWKACDQFRAEKAERKNKARLLRAYGDGHRWLRGEEERHVA